MQRKFIGLLIAISLCLTPLLLPAQETGDRIIKDMTGRKVVLTGPVHRVVTTFKPASLCVLSLGLAHTLVGVDNSSRKDPLQVSVCPDIQHLAGVGTKSMGINLETLVSLKPDLVIFYSQNDGLSATEKLAAMGIPCIVILPESFDSILQAMEIIAQAMGDSQRISLVRDQMEAVLSLVDARLSDLPDSRKKTGYFASTLGLFSTTTGSILQDEIFSRARIRNASSHLTGYFQDISPEQLVEWNPDIMILSQHMKKSQFRLLDLAPLQGVTAISQNQVFRCPSSLAQWDFPSPLAVLATLWVAKKAYPETFTDVDIVAQADAFHENLFGQTMTQMGGTLEDTID
jgi:iron complex transport system substrate-binding protein